ncbi:hypothetical protein O3G_MSEX015248 [Manduca sexta]|uniref:Uncharacterized protein n=1 Tax=Manduca sexta TaxID=7130 RepID=A0A921ZYD2_MANSE|nr:hypothetical protein O3G_MSEX015248 [Manduca sexta]
MMEWRIARSGVIEYSGDLMVPPEDRKKTINVQSKKTIRGTTYDSDSDLELSD